MDFSKKDKVNRRKFVKGLACTTVCCAYFPLDGFSNTAKNPKNKINDGKQGNEFLAAACGTYCGACPAYIAKHGDQEHIKARQKKKLAKEPSKAQKGIPPSNWMDGLLCDGCLSGGALAAHCQRCDIRLHALSKQINSRCSDCEELPCYRIDNLMNMGHYLHREEYLPNLQKIREMGVQEWIKYEEKRWSCPRCGLPMSWYDAECTGCGEPRSKDLFPLSNN